MTATGSDLADELLDVRPSDGFVVLSYDPPGGPVDVVLSQAAAAGAAVVLVTDAPSRRSATVVLPVGRGDPRHVASHAATLAVLESLVLALAARHDRRADAAAGRLRDLRADITAASRRPMNADDRRRSWALLRQLMSDHRRVLAGAIVGGLLWQMAGLVVPLILGWIVDEGIEGGDPQTVWIGAGVLVGLGAIEAGGAALRHRYACRAFMAGSADLRCTLTDAALRLDDEGQATFPPGEVVARVTSDTSTIADLLDAVGHTIATAVSVPVILVALTIIDPILGLVVALLVPVSLVLTFKYSVVWERRSTAAQDSMGETVQRAQEAVENGKALRGIGAEAATVDRFALQSAELRRRSIHLADLWIIFEPLLESLSLVSVTLVLWIGGTRVIDGGMPLGDVIAAVGLVLFLAGPVRTVGGRILTVQSALASAARVVHLVDAAPPADERTDAPELAPAAPALSARSLLVARRGGDDRPLARAELDLWPGSLTVLAGSTGSGKSTILAALAGWRDALDGGLDIAGAAIADWPTSALRQRVLLVDTAPFLFAGTVGENLRFADPDASDATVHAALAAAHCDFVERLPDGLDSVIGERGVDLSGGQRQRLAIARALLARPEVLLVDGATSALDPTTEVHVVQAIRSSLPDAAVVVVSDNPDVVALADALLSLRDGELVSS